MHLANLVKNLESFRPGEMVCGKCGAHFAQQRIAHSRLGDPACPKCGSVDIRYQATRAERARSFLIDYNTY